MNKERKSYKKGNFLNKPLTKKILILFVGNWLLKALLKPLVSVGRRWGLLWSCWSLVISAPAQRQDRETLEAFWEQIKMDHNLVLFFLDTIFFKRDYLKFSLL